MSTEIASTQFVNNYFGHQAHSPNIANVYIVAEEDFMGDEDVCRQAGD
jgi:hypothetical protein